MKKLIYILTATAFAFVSCNKTTKTEAQMVTLDYNVAVPAALTKVATIGDASHVNELVCAVYEDGVELTRQTIEYEAGNSLSYKPSLYIGREYQIVFWAHKKDYYDLSDLTDITWKDGFKTNDENADAFTFTETVKINSDKTVTVVSSQESGSTTREAILRRPFVGLNLKLKVSDIPDGLSHSRITFSKLQTHYDAVAGEEVSDKMLTETSSSAEILPDLVTIDGIEYRIISLNYLIPGSTPDITIEVASKDFNSPDFNPERDILLNFDLPDNLPLNPNVQINITANLKAELEYTITINDDFSDGDQNHNIK